MLQNFKTESEDFHEQRWLPTLILLLLATGMVAVGLKELVSGQLLAPNKFSSPAALTPVRLAIPGAGFEVRLGETGLNQAGQLAGAGLLKSGPRPGEPGTAVIGINQDWPVAKLKPGDRLEITGQAGGKLAFEIISTTAATSALLVAEQASTGNKELKLVVVEPGERAVGLVISARLVVTK